MTRLLVKLSRGELLICFVRFKGYWCCTLALVVKFPKQLRRGVVDHVGSVVPNSDKARKQEC